MIMGNAVWQLVSQADAISKSVLLILLGMSITCWTLFLYKVITFRLKQKQLRIALQSMRNLETFEQLLAVSGAITITFPGYFLSHNLGFLKSLLRSSDGLKKTLTSAEWDAMQMHVAQTVDDMMHYQEQYLGFLNMSIAVAPLLGLFGTVWGLIHSFIRISELQNADIVTVAPGIAEALITTMAGLLVAIPAALMFFYLRAVISSIEHQLTMVADRTCWLLQRLFVG